MAGTQKQRDQLIKNLITLQMETIGKRYVDWVEVDNPREIYRMTEEQYQTFDKKAIYLIKKTKKCNSGIARKALNEFNYHIGLAVYTYKPTFWDKVRKFFIGY
jgi:hypothetical protein